MMRYMQTDNIARQSGEGVCLAPDTSRDFTRLFFIQAHIPVLYRQYIDLTWGIQKSMVNRVLLVSVSVQFNVC